VWWSSAGVESALRPARAAQLTTIYWVGVAAFRRRRGRSRAARSLASRVGTLVQGARNIAQGKLDAEIEVASNDELGELAKSASTPWLSSLSAARSEILLRNEEIRVGTSPLEKRVDDKTTELARRPGSLVALALARGHRFAGAGVAHEINNPLTGVLGLAQILLADLPEGHPVRPMIKDIESRPRAFRPSWPICCASRRSSQASTSVPSIFRGRSRRARAVRGQGPGPTRALPCQAHPQSSPLIRGSALQVQAALIQLIQNARAAMDSGGTLTMETTRPDDKLLRLARERCTGSGIKPEQLSRIFESFFTTRRSEPTPA